VLASVDTWDDFNVERVVDVALAVVCSVAVLAVTDANVDIAVDAAADSVLATAWRTRMFELEVLREACMVTAPVEYRLSMLLRAELTLLMFVLLVAILAVRVDWALCSRVCVDIVATFETYILRLSFLNYDRFGA
jgi:hypothetical protein